jgi:hypothetical protein
LFMLVTKRKTKNTADVTRKPLIPAWFVFRCMSNNTSFVFFPFKYGF